VTVVTAPAGAPPGAHRPPSIPEQRFAVVDVETSGLSARRHRILQIAVVTVRGDGTVLDRWSSEVRPTFGRLGLGRVGPSHIHGLTARGLRHAPSWAEVAPALLDRLDGAVFCAHNVRFDWAFVRRGLERAGYRPPDATRLCTMRLSRALDPDHEQSHRLADVAQRYGVPIDRPHDALADAEATSAVLPHLLAASGAASLGELGTIGGCLEGQGTRWPSPRRPPFADRLNGRLRATRRTRR
jgi:DNA polymerase-3 subunit epsilon